jgi:hypothetical protein
MLFSLLERARRSVSGESGTAKSMADFPFKWLNVDKISFKIHT